MTEATRSALLGVIRQICFEEKEIERFECARLVEQAKVAVSNETNPATVCDRLAKMIRERK